MAERLNTTPRSSGLSRTAVRRWGLLCLTLGAVGFAVFRNGLLGLNTISSEALLAAMEADSRVMGYATIAIVLNAVHCCAAPLFAFLLVEGFRNTGSWGKYLLRVLGAAILSEIPFNLAAGGRWIDTGSRSPVFALVLSLVMLYFYRRYQEKSFAGYAVKAAVTAAAILWAIMLGIEDGASLVLLTAVLWACRNKKVLQMIFGCLAAFACSLFSPFYVASPIAFIVLHFYNGEKGDSNPWVDYLSYPAVLLALGLLGKYLI